VKTSFTKRECSSGSNGSLIKDTKPLSDLSPEEYVGSLYRALLKRAPDDEGLRVHASDLRKHGDYTRILRIFLDSEEFRDVEFRARAGIHGGETDSTSTRTAATELPEDPLQTRHLIECSRGHFDDVSFIENIAKRSRLYGRHKRKIEIIAIYYPKMNNGGTERVTALQILAWKRLGYGVVLITDLPRDEKRDYDYGDVERFILPPKMMENDDYRPRGTALAEILTQARVDLFVNNLWDETSTVWDVLVAKSLGIPVVVGWHNVFDTRIRRPDDLRLANMRFSGFKYADLVTVLSTVDKIWFRSRGVLSRVVHNPMIFDALPARSAPLDGHTIVWVARAERHQKRLDLVIRLFPLVLAKVPDAQLLIVGGGPDLDWAKEYARSLGVASRIEFTGYTTNVSQYLDRADIHVLTSEFEGWCLALGEAWAHGVPSVMFELPHLEYVQSGKGFLAVKMLDLQAMADAVIGLLLDTGLRKKLGAEAREVMEEFDLVSFEGEWRKIFHDLESEDDLDTPLAQEQELRGLKTLTRMIGDRLLSLSGGERSDHYVPVLPSAVPVLPPRTRWGRLAYRAARIAVAPVALAERAITRSIPSDGRLRMIDLSHVGLGDNVMIWTGLFALLQNDVPICAPGCLLHVQPILADFAENIFSRFGIVVQRGRPSKSVHPVYTPLPPTNRREWWNAYAGRDWRMNWVEAQDLQRTFPREGADRSFVARVRLLLTEKLVYGRQSWTQAVPGYVGFRAWSPLALKHGVYPVVFMSQLKRSLIELRKIASDYVDSFTPLDLRTRYAGAAAFPVGKSFQTIPPRVYKQVNDILGGDFFTCYVQNDSPWWPDFEINGVQLQHIPDIKDTFRHIKYAEHLLTTDSFTSHLAQLLRDDFVLVLSRDLREGVVHPGADPRVVANHPACAPCNYQERQNFSHCVAGYNYCIAFNNSEFVGRIAEPFVLSLQAKATRAHVGAA
jgi:glycosyltransferase involved in cell wall biosynthesis